jgi:hypothetical protein
MKSQLLRSLALATFAFVIAVAQNASAIPSIVITTVVDNTGTDNVLFNDGTLQHTGSQVFGNFSGAGLGYVVKYTSSSGNGQIEGDGGQATVSGLLGNDPFTSLTFSLTNNATFTAAVLNPDVVNADGDGTINFIVSYILGDGLGPYTETLTVNANGQNFFRIDAIPNARMTSVTFNSTDSTFADVSQMRIGGFAPEISTSVPEGGATVALLGMAFGGMWLFQRSISKRHQAQ